MGIFLLAEYFVSSVRFGREPVACWIAPRFVPDWPGSGWCFYDFKEQRVPPFSAQVRGPPA